MKIEGLERVLWSPFKNKVITYRKQDGDLIKTFYSYEDGRHAELDPRMEKIDWSPSGQGIIYHFVNPRGESTISISWPDGSEWRRITKMEIERVQVAWPSSLMISVATPGASFYSSSLTLMSLNEDSQRKIAKGIDVDVPLKWHPKGRMFLYKRTDRENLYLYDLETGGQNLELEAAPSKCSWSKEGRSIFCAVTAENIIEQGLLPESYARRLLPQSDSFWQIDLEEKKVRELYIPESQENVINVKKDSLLVSPNQDYLFWVDSGDGKLYRLKL